MELQVKARESGADVRGMEKRMKGWGGGLFNCSKVAKKEKKGRKRKETEQP